MKIKEGFLLREIANTIVAVPTGDLVNEFQGIIHLNATSRFMWELLENDISENELVQKLVERYQIDEERAKANVAKFVANLRDVNIIVEQ